MNDELWAEALAGYDEPPKRKPPARTRPWKPDLNPTQQRIFDDPHKFVLGYGEKGSGKTIGFAHKIVRHAYENANALVLIIAPTIRTGSEGIWHDLETLVLPQWREGMGLEFTNSKLDPNTKDRHLWIQNRFGGWSKLLLVSIPFAIQVQSRVKGPAPSLVYVDELTNCEGREYFTYPAAQLGRRRGIEGPQQFLASCNPAGPSHWVYKVFFEESKDADGNLKPGYSIYHVPITENVHRLPPGYVEQLNEIFCSDEVERKRLIDGEWIDRPSGKAIFKEVFSKTLHVRGDARAGVGLVPLKNHPIIVGYDPGPVNFSVHLLQLIPTREGKLIWTVFDELNFVGQRLPYFRVVPRIMRRMLYWRNRVQFQFTFEHIADDAAFRQLRSDGSFDNLEIERLSREFLRRNPECGLQPIHLKACPKGPDTVPARVRLVISLFQQESLYISELCRRTLEMFDRLESEEEKAGKYDPMTGFRPRRSIHIHAFDSLSYPLFYYSVGPVRHVAATERIEPRTYLCGATS